MKDLDNKKMPIFLKIIIAGVPIILIIVYLIFTTNRDLQNREQFFIQEFSSVVISSNNSSTGRSIEFHLSNGLKIYFGHSISPPWTAIGAARRNIGSSVWTAPIATWPFRLRHYSPLLSITMTIMVLKAVIDWAPKT